MPRLYTALFLLTCLCLSSALLRAQVTSADVVGTATDATGAVVAGVKVTITNVDTQDRRTAETNSAGEYVFTLLKVGRYAVRAEMSGFRTFNASGLSLAAGDRLRVDIRLELGGVEQAVEVTATAPALQTDSTTLGSLVTQKAVEDLPVNGRNFVRLAQLAPGAYEGSPNSLQSGNRPDDRRRSSSVTVNGQTDIANNYMIDGIDNNQGRIGTIIVKPSMDALAEFRVQTNLYTAEVGRTAGGVVNLITKSGTNSLHGALFEYLRNDKFEARNFFAAAGPAPAYRQNQFGANAGGPIIRNRTFFFADYEGFRTSQGLTYVTTVPTDAMKGGNFAGVNVIYDPLSLHADAATGKQVRDRFPSDAIPTSRIDPIAAKYVALYPSPQRSTAANNFTLSPPKTQRDDTFDVRIDHRFSDKDFFYGRYSFNDTNTVIPSMLPAVNGIDPGGSTSGYFGPSLQRNQGLHLNLVHVISPSLVFEGKAGYSRFVNRTQIPNYGQMVSKSFGLNGANLDLQTSGLTPVSVSGYAALGDSTQIPSNEFVNLFQYSGSLTWIKGTHSVKAGADLKRRQATSYKNRIGLGTYAFDANATNDPTGVVKSGNGLASFLLGIPASLQRNNVLREPGLRTWEYAGFIQDDWRVQRWLTLNIGLRYDLFEPFTEVVNRMANFDLATGKMLVAGANGVDKYAGVTASKANLAPRFGFAATVGKGFVVRGGYGVSYFPAHYRTIASYENPPFVYTYAATSDTVNPQLRLSNGVPVPVLTDPNNLSGSVNAIARNFKDTRMQQFNLTVQREMFGFVGGVGYVGSLGRHLLVNISNYDTPLPAAGSIQPRRPYTPLVPAVTTIALYSTDAISNYNGLQLTLERRYKKGLTINSNYTWAHGIDDAGEQGAAGKASGSAYPQIINRRDLERGSSDLDIRQRFVLMANYELPFGKTLKGFSSLVVSGWQMNAIVSCRTGQNFTVTNAAARANTGASDRPDRVGKGALSGGERSIARWFDTSAFTGQALYTAGSAGRNILYGPPQRQLDLSLFKEFPVTERWKLQFRAESFNLTNTPNFGAPGASLGTAAFGTIASTDGAPPRQLQFALKLAF